MNYSDLILLIEKKNESLFTQEKPPHSTNLLHQLRKGDESKLEYFNAICKKYIELRNAAESSISDYHSFVYNLVDAANNYMDCFKENNPFSHQQDFTSSIVPEFFFLLLSAIVKNLNLDLFVSAQSQVPIECLFDLHDGGRMMFKTKRLDMLVAKKTSIRLQDKAYPFIIPVIAMEMKTNLDKNMLAGIEHSVTSLKKTFPKCSYFVITELSDMAIDKLNYAASDIDEIYIIRKQKRIEVRRNKNIRKSISKDLILDIVINCVSTLKSNHTSSPSINDRMHNGKLISFNG